MAERVDPIGTPAAVNQAVRDDEKLLVVVVISIVIVIGGLRWMPVARLVRATRPKSDGAPDFVRELVDWGAGPRAGQFLIHGGKALAAMLGMAQTASKNPPPDLTPLTERPSAHAGASVRLARSTAVAASRIC